MTDIVRIFVGFDEREAAAYHVFCQSVLERSSVPVAFIPLHKEMLRKYGWRSDGTTAFTLSRYLVPLLCAFQGRAMFADGDMVVDRDIEELFVMQSGNAVDVVHHEYTTKHRRKMIGSSMECANLDYPRKNWSSVILWNCEHPSNRVLTAENVAAWSPSYLHRFSWLQDKEIGALPEWWNHLVGEAPPASPALYHYTLGIPAFKHYADDFGSWKWHGALIRALQCGDDPPSTIVARAEGRVGDVSPIARGAA